MSMRIIVIGKENDKLMLRYLHREVISIDGLLQGIVWNIALHIEEALQWNPKLSPCKYLAS